MSKFQIGIILKRFFRNKLNYLVVILIGICFAFSIMVNSLTYSATEHYKKHIFNWIDNRIFYVRVGEKDDPSLESKKKELTNLLNSFPEVEGVFTYDSYMSYWSLPELLEEYPDWHDDIAIGVNGMVGTLEAAVGKDLPTTDDMVMVCPVAFYPYETTNGPVKEKRIDLTKYIGKTFTLKYIDTKKPKEFQVKLIGLYDNEVLNKNYSDCYVNYQTASKMNIEVLPKNDSYLYYELKNIVHEEKVTNALRELGYWPESKIFMHNKVALESMEVMVYISYGIFIISMFIALCLLYFNTIKNNSVIKMQKILGYTNHNLLLNYIVESMLLFIMSIICVIITSLILLIVFQKVIPLYYKAFNNIRIILSINAIISNIPIIFGLTIFIGILRLLATFKKNI